ncbi:transglutaminase domain-containing protein [Flavobacterium psychrotrophum]|uniref:transglutaminase domain-containing protein n=1 Tax=Flavobacterium psychrotrophum TaxID=2294119 RepID=UPI000E320CD7|nr:transglutaminase domain-containing protein [Flavobacterium psychrotrophum]
MPKNFFLICLFFTGSLSFAQLTAIAKAPAVTVADLKEAAHPADTSAVAAVQHQYGNIWFDIIDNKWVMNTEVFTRIKIYKKEGYNWANWKKEYYAKDNLVKLTITDGATYNLVGTNIEKTFLKTDGIFEDAPAENWKRTSVKMPNVKEGSIIEFKYTLRSRRLTPDDFYFQHAIPVNHVRLDVAAPTYFYFNVFTLGYVDVKHNEPFSRLNTEIVNKIERVNEVRENISTYYADNLKAISGDEPYVNNIENYTGLIRHELAAFAQPFSPAENYAVNWETVAKTVYDNDNFGRELRYDSYFKADLAVVLAGAKTNGEKMNSIFSYVKSRMNWNGYNRLLCKDGVKKAYENKAGNAAEINLMLTAMLREAGLEANPVLVSTRDNGVAVYPSVDAYNYVICAVKEGDKNILLDATSKFSVPNLLPVRAINWDGRMIKKNGNNEEINLMPDLYSKEVINVMADVSKEGKVTGKLRHQHIDYNAYTFRERYVDLTPESYLDKLEEKYKGLEVTDYKVTNEKDLTKPVSEDYSFTHNGLVDVIGDMIYINPMLFFAQHTNPFKQDKRAFPIDFVFAQQEKYLMNIKVPDGYSIASLPVQLKLAMEDGLGSFQYTVQPSPAGNVVQLSATFQLNSPVISASYYTTLKDFFQKMIEKQNEKIVLKKS